MSCRAPSLKHTLGVSKTLLHCSFEDNQRIFFWFKFLPCFCSNSITIKHHFEDKCDTPSEAHNTPAEAHLHSLPLTGSDGTNWWCKSFILKKKNMRIMRKEGKKHEEEESCKVRRTCSARSFTKILQQFTATLHLTHLTIPQVCDPDSYSCHDSCN